MSSDLTFSATIPSSQAFVVGHVSAFGKTTVKHDRWESKWLIWCHCQFQPLRWSYDWRLAQEWAAAHAAEHEAQRCPHCGRLP